MFMRLTCTCMLCIEKGLPLAILGRVSGPLCPVWAVSDCCSLLYLLDMWLSASFWCMMATSLLVTLYDITFCIRCFHGMVCKLQSLGKCHVCYVVLWPSACIHAVVELFLFHNWLPQVRWPLLCMALYMKNFLFVSCACAYVCVTTCVCRVHTHVCVVGVGRERKKSWNYPYKNRSVSGSEKPLLVLPRRKSKKLELAHCPPKCELIHLNREWRDPNAPVARGSYLWMQMGTLVRTIGHVLY